MYLHVFLFWSLIIRNIEGKNIHLNSNSGHFLKFFKKKFQFLLFVEMFQTAKIHFIYEQIFFLVRIFFVCSFINDVSVFGKHSNSIWLFNERWNEMIGFSKIQKKVWLPLVIIIIIIIIMILRTWRERERERGRKLKDINNSHHHFFRFFVSWIRMAITSV